MWRKTLFFYGIGRERKSISCRNNDWSWNSLMAGPSISLSICVCLNPVLANRANNRTLEMHPPRSMFRTTRTSSMLEHHLNVNTRFVLHQELVWINIFIFSSQHTWIVELISTPFPLNRYGLVWIIIMFANVYFSLNDRIGMKPYQILLRMAEWGYGSAMLASISVKTEKK